MGTTRGKTLGMHEQEKKGRTTFWIGVFKKRNKFIKTMVKYHLMVSNNKKRLLNNITTTHFLRLICEMFNTPEGGIDGRTLCRRVVQCTLCTLVQRSNTRSESLDARGITFRKRNFKSEYRSEYKICKCTIIVNIVTPLNVVSSENFLTRLNCMTVKGTVYTDKIADDKPKPLFKKQGYKLSSLIFAMYANTRISLKNISCNVMCLAVKFQGFAIWSVCNFREKDIKASVHRIWFSVTNVRSREMAGRYFLEPINVL
jgi:hypothetical protein